MILSEIQDLPALSSCNAVNFLIIITIFFILNLLIKKKNALLNLSVLKKETIKGQIF